MSPIQLAAALEDRFGPTFVSPSLAQQVIEGSVTTAARGYVVLLRVIDEQGVVRGERAFVSTDRDCSTLLRPLLLVIGLMLDPEGRWDAQMPSLFGLDPKDSAASLLAELSAQPTAAPAPVSVPVAAPVPALPAPAPPEPRTPSTLALDGLAGVGIDARASLGLRARLDVPFARRWTLETSAIIDLPRTHELAGPGELTTQTLAGWFGGCPLILGEALRFEACSGGSLGAQRLTARKLNDALDGWSLAVGAWLDLRVKWQLSPRGGIASGAIGYVPILQPEPTYRAPGSTPKSVFDPLILSGWGYLGGFLSF